jgi:hypothetical protein
MFPEKVREILEIWYPNDGGRAEILTIKLLALIESELLPKEHKTVDIPMTTGLPETMPYCKNCKSLIINNKAECEFNQCLHEIKERLIGKV